MCALSVLSELASGWNWDALSAISTFFATLVALFGWTLRESFVKPRLKVIGIDNQPSTIRKKINNHDGTVGYKIFPAYWTRIKIENSGRSPANGCIGKAAGGKALTFGANPTLRDIDPAQLRWVGVPIAEGFRPIKLVKGQPEFLNVLRFYDYNYERKWSVQLETEQKLDPGYDLSFPPGQEHRIGISIFSDNGDTATGILEFKYSGKSDQNSLDIPEINYVRLV